MYTLVYTVYFGYHIITPVAYIVVGHLCVHCYGVPCRLSHELWGLHGGVYSEVYNIKPCRMHCHNLWCIRGVHLVLTQHSLLGLLGAARDVFCVCTKPKLVSVIDEEMLRPTYLPFFNQTPPVTLRVSSIDAHLFSVRNRGVSSLSIEKLLV